MASLKIVRVGVQAWSSYMRVQLASDSMVSSLSLLEMASVYSDNSLLRVEAHDLCMCSTLPYPLNEHCLDWSIYFSLKEPLAFGP